MDMVSFIVEGKPVAKARARAFRMGNKIGHYTPEKTVTYESFVRLCAAREMVGREPFDGALALTIVIFLEIPKSWSKKKREDALIGKLYPTSKPDIDNIIKSLKDGMNGIVYRDDSQVVDIRAKKRYAENPLVKIDAIDAKMFCG